MPMPIQPIESVERQFFYVLAGREIEDRVDLIDYAG
jgi:hypothetical protein